MPDAAHDEQFYRLLAAEEAKLPPHPKRKISAAAAEALVDRTVRRGAISEHRRGYYLAQAAAGQDISILDELAPVYGPTDPLRAAAAPPDGDTTFSANPLLDEYRASHPALVQAALADNPSPPRLFGSRDLPLSTASGLDPHILGGLPWPLRRTVAAAATLHAAYELIDQYGDAEPGDPSLWELRFRRENSDYLQEFAQWLTGPAGRQPASPYVRASAAQEDAEDALYESLFGKG
ncbi:MAG TPA: hypothetical protein VIV12_28570 [Streptosporangiaceae bacterium]